MKKPFLHPNLFRHSYKMPETFSTTTAQVCILHLTPTTIPQSWSSIHLWYLWRCLVTITMTKTYYRLSLLLLELYITTLWEEEQDWHDMRMRSAQYYQWQYWSNVEELCYRAKSQESLENNELLYPPVKCKHVIATSVMAAAIVSRVLCEFLIRTMNR